MKIERVIGNVIDCNVLSICITIEVEYFDGVHEENIVFEIYRDCFKVETIDTNLEDAINYCGKFGENK